MIAAPTYYPIESVPGTMSPYKKSLIWLIVIATCCRCIVASVVELGNDEVYYWTYSQYLQWNYFDHPPMVSLMIRLFTGDLALQSNELFIRMGSIVCSGLATWVIFRLVTDLSSEKAGFVAALLYTTSLYSSVIAGIFCMPDSPQMLWWTLSLWTLARLTQPSQEYRTRWIPWLLLGIFTGLCTMSKIHGVFIWAGLGLYTLFYKREWLKNPWLYLSFFISIAIALPIFFWNYSNHFITYQFHSQRVGVRHFQSDSFFREIVGEVFYNNPINFILSAIAVTAFFKHKKLATAPPFLKLALLIALPMIGVLIGMSMFNDTLPHWSGPAYVTLIPMVSLYLTRPAAKPFGCPVIVKYALGLILFTLVAAVYVIEYFPGTLSNKKTESVAGEGDFTLDMYGWRQAEKKMAQIKATDLATGQISPDVCFISNKWFPAAHIDFYIARPMGMKVIGLGTMFDLHHYVWLNTYALQNKKSFTDAYCIVPSNYTSNVRDLYKNDFSTIDSVTTFPVMRGGEVCRFFSVYRLRGFHGTVPEIE